MKVVGTVEETVQEAKDIGISEVDPRDLLFFTDSLWESFSPLYPPSFTPFHSSSLRLKAYHHSYSRPNTAHDPRSLTHPRDPRFPSYGNTSQNGPAYPPRTCWEKDCPSRFITMMTVRLRL